MTKLTIIVTNDTKLYDTNDTKDTNDKCHLINNT